MRIAECEKKIRKCMERCLILVLNSGMIAAEDADWFERYRAADQEANKKTLWKTIIKKEHETVFGCDLQAVLKMLFFWDTCRNVVFPELDEKEANRINTTLQSLIDFRNSELAHVPVFTQKVKAPGEYSVDNAILDMMYILRKFPAVRGPAPQYDEEQPAPAEEICYYDEAQQVYNRYKAEGGLWDYPVAQTIGEYKLSIPEKTFVDACDALGIITVKDREGCWYFSSRDPRTDVTRVQESFRMQAMEQALHAASAQTRKHSNKKLIIILSSAGAVVLAIIFLVLALTGGKGMSGQNGGSNLGDMLSGIMGGVSSVDDRIQEEIDTFIPNGGNHTQLKVGEGHRADGAVWLNGGGASCYSTDESVVTVSSTGNVKAVGEGEAFVVVKTITGMFQVHKYTVQGKYQTQDELIQEEIDTFVSDYGNTVQLKVGEGHSPDAAVWLGQTGSCYSTNENVVTISSTGNVKAVGEGEAFVVIKASTGMFEVYKYVVQGVYKTQEELIQEEMDNFVPTFFNSFQLAVGDAHTPTAAVWGGGSGYSTDETVVKLTSSGSVIAVGPGTAFVVIKASTGSMYDVLQYTVTE